MGNDSDKTVTLYTYDYQDTMQWVSRDRVDIPPREERAVIGATGCARECTKFFVHIYVDGTCVTNHLNGGYGVMVMSGTKDAVNRQGDLGTSAFRMVAGLLANPSDAIKDTGFAHSNSKVVEAA